MRERERVWYDREMERDRERDFLFLSLRTSLRRCQSSSSSYVPDGLSPAGWGNEVLVAHRTCSERWPIDRNPFAVSFYMTPVTLTLCHKSLIVAVHVDQALNIPDYIRPPIEVDLSFTLAHRFIFIFQLSPFGFSVQDSWFCFIHMFKWSQSQNDDIAHLCFWILGTAAIQSRSRERTRWGVALFWSTVNFVDGPNKHTHTQFF